MSWDGYYIKAANGTVLDPYFNFEGYKATPDQRQDKDSYRDGYGVLHRNVLPGKVSTLELTTVDGLTLSEITALKAAIASGITNALERKTSLTYWNDEIMDYCTDTFYMPDITYPHKGLVNDIPTYNSFTIKFVGYGEIR